MGSVRRRGDYYFIDYRVNGHRVRKKIGSSKKLAELAVHDIELKIARREIGFVEKDSDLDGLFDRFLRYSRTNHSPGTTKRYREILNNFRAFLKLHPTITRVEHLEPRVFEDYKTFRREGNGAARIRTDLQGHGVRPVKTRTVNTEVKTLRTMFNFGIEWNLVRENPTKGVRMLKEVDMAQPRFLSEEECQTLIAACDEVLRPIVITLLNTGMRRGELMHLEWPDVDFDRAMIHIRSKPQWKWHPKTTNRDIPLNETAFRLLRELHGKRRKDTKLVFPDEAGRPYQRNRLRMMLISTAKRAGLKDVTKLHSLRHTFASHLVMGGVDLPSVQRLMGHADIETTMIYSHLAPDHLQGAIEKLSFGQKRPSWAPDGQHTPASSHPMPKPPSPRPQSLCNGL